LFLSKSLSPPNFGKEPASTKYLMSPIKALRISRFLDKPLETEEFPDFKINPRLYNLTVMRT